MTPVLVITHRLDGIPEQQTVIDYDETPHRRWLACHSNWALRNDRRVTTEPTALPIDFKPSEKHRQPRNRAREWA
jgi:hypothetical protein